MCLAIPGKVVETYREHDVLMGKVDFGGICKRVCLEHVPDAGLDDYVLVHVGFALSRIDEAEAKRVFEFLGQMDQLDELADDSESREGEAPWEGEAPSEPLRTLARTEPRPPRDRQHRSGGPSS
jgi:hydrogenase expression/formation protein HypC